MDPMRQGMRATAIAIVALTVGAAARPTTPTGRADARYMFPAAIVLRGGGLHDPIVFTHAGAHGLDLSADTIPMIYQSLSVYAPKLPDAVRRRPFIEVAEFFGPDYIGYWSGTTAPPPFELANYHSRIYLPRDGEPALWENPVVALGGAQRAFYQLGAAATRVLEHRGVKVR